MNKSLVQDLDNYLLLHSQRILNLSFTPTEVSIRPHETVWFANLRSGDETRDLVVKEQSKYGVGGLESLFSVHCQLRKRIPFVSDRTVEFLGIDSDRSLLFLEAVQGLSLTELLQRSFRQRAPAFFAAETLDQLARVLSAVHDLEPTDLGLAPALRPYEELRIDLQKKLEDPAISRWLPARYRRLDSFYRRLQEPLWDESSERLLFADLQPKNILVRPDGRICLIDIDYYLGRPAWNLAGTLVNLDLLAIRRPTGPSLRITANWKRILVDSYMATLSSDGRQIAEELVFFYPWSLLRLYRQHLQRRAFMKPFLSWFYCRLLTYFFSELEGRPETAPYYSGLKVALD